MEKKQIIEAMHNRLHEIDPHAKAILFGRVSSSVFQFLVSKTM